MFNFSSKWKSVSGKYSGAAKKISSNIAKGKKAKNKYFELLTNNEVFIHFFGRLSDLEKYQNQNKERAEKSIEYLIEGCGGIKNIVSVSRSVCSVNIKFRNRYQVKEDILKKSGGLGLWIGNYEIVCIFDFLEAKQIVNSIRKAILDSKNGLLVMDFY